MPCKPCKISFPKKIDLRYYPAWFLPRMLLDTPIFQIIEVLKGTKLQIQGWTTDERKNWNPQIALGMECSEQGKRHGTTAIWRLHLYVYRGGNSFMFRWHSEFLKEFTPRFGVLKMHPHAINAWQLPPKNVARVGEMTHTLMIDWHNWLRLMWDSLSGLQRWTISGFNIFLHVLTHPPKRSYLNQSYPNYDWKNTSIWTPQPD